MRKISVNSIESIVCAITDLENELSDLIKYPQDELRSVIKEIGFECTACGRCCTKEFNDHVFLLTKDLLKAKKNYADAIVPAPYFEICDQNGNFYVSGYALKVKKNGDCIFLEDNRCRIYDNRFSICRVYPYMLHRERDKNGKTEWRQISGLNKHGEYNTEISDDLCNEYANETIEYEKDFLIQERDFFIRLLSLFRENNLKPVRRIYDQKMRQFEKGEKITIFAFNGESFEENTISKDDYISG